jgi:sialidase-1
LLSDRRTGRVFLFYAYGPPGIGFFRTHGSQTLHAEVQWSDDDGLTWSRPRDLNAQIKDPFWRAIFASSGHGVQLKRGRLV